MQRPGVALGLSNDKLSVHCRTCVELSDPPMEEARTSRDWQRRARRARQRVAGQGSGGYVMSVIMLGMDGKRLTCKGLMGA